MTNELVHNACARDPMEIITEFKAQNPNYYAIAHSLTVDKVLLVVVGKVLDSKELGYMYRAVSYDTLEGIIACKNTLPLLDILLDLKTAIEEELKPQWEPKDCAETSKLLHDHYESKETDNHE